MAGGEPEIGDKVSWNWGGGAPGGTVAEKKTEGEIAIQSKKGNTIKKNASKDNPAVHISRSGNDVVKRVSELNVDKKGSGGSKRKHEDQEEKEDKNEDEIEKNDQGKDVRAGGKKQKKGTNQKEKETDDTKPKANEKKAGRPKGSDGAKSAAKKEKKPSKPRNTEGISGRTRSQKK